MATCNDYDQRAFTSAQHLVIAEWSGRRLSGLKAHISKDHEEFAEVAEIEGRRSNQSLYAIIATGRGTFILDDWTFGDHVEASTIEGALAKALEWERDDRWSDNQQVAFTPEQHVAIAAWSARRPSGLLARVHNDHGAIEEIAEIEGRQANVCLFGIVATGGGTVIVEDWTYGTRLELGTVEAALSTAAAWQLEQR